MLIYLSSHLELDGPEGHHVEHSTPPPEKNKQEPFPLEPGCEAEHTNAAHQGTMW